MVDSKHVVSGNCWTGGVLDTAAGTLDHFNSVRFSCSVAFDYGLDLDATGIWTWSAGTFTTT